jgi:penicillin-binding protein 2
LLFVLFCVLVVLGLRLFYLQVIRHGYYNRLALANRVQRERIIAPRGLIRARDGSKLVVNVPTYQISILPGMIRGRLDHLSLACEWLGIDEHKLQEDLAAWRERYPDGREMPVVQAASKEQISILRELRAQLSFFRLEMKPRRQYPEGTMAVHILGHVGEVTDEELSNSDVLNAGDLIGRTGVEKTYDRYLRGVDGVRLVEISAEGTRIGEISGFFADDEMEEMFTSQPPVPGNDVYLTLDIDLQRALEEMFEWERGSVIIMNPRNGAILAAVSRPPYRPNIFLEGVSETKWKSLYEDPAKPLFHRTVQATYPPGSVFKLVTAYAALEEKIVSSNSYMEPCFGAYKFGNRYFGCWKPEGHGSLALYGSLVNSCDVYFYQIGELMTANQFSDAGKLFGYGEKTGIDLPSEARGILPDHAYFDRRYGKRKWTKGHLLNYSIGQGELLATPIQICLMAAIFANGGRWVEPHCVEKILDADGQVVFEGVTKGRTIPGLNRSALHLIRNAMRGVIADKNGTGRAAAVPGFGIAGKTGTAQNPHGEDHALFVAYAPADRPEIVVTVIMENAGHGGAMAAPLARQIFESYFLPVAGVNADYEVLAGDAD